MKRTAKKSASKKRSKRAATKMPALAERVLLLSSDGRIIERNIDGGEEVELEPDTEEATHEQDRRRAITIEVDGRRSRIKGEFPLLASEYDESSLMSKIANSNLSIYRSIIVTKIEEIKQRKNLSINEVQKDEEVFMLLKQRDKELRLLNAVMIDALLNRKKQPRSHCEEIEAEILAARNKVKNSRLKNNANKLAEIMNKQSGNALRMELWRRCHVNWKDFMKANR
jgi:hypothetical protein